MPERFEKLKGFVDGLFSPKPPNGFEKLHKDLDKLWLKLQKASASSQVRERAIDEYYHKNTNFIIDTYVSAAQTNPRQAFKELIKLLAAPKDKFDYQDHNYPKSDLLQDLWNHKAARECFEASLKSLPIHDFDKTDTYAYLTTFVLKGNTSAPFLISHANELNSLIASGDVQPYVLNNPLFYYSAPLAVEVLTALEDGLSSYFKNPEQNEVRNSVFIKRAITAYFIAVGTEIPPYLTRAADALKNFAIAQIFNRESECTAKIHESVCESIQILDNIKPAQSPVTYTIDETGVQLFNVKKSENSDDSIWVLCENKNKGQLLVPVFMNRSFPAIVNALQNALTNFSQPINGFTPEKLEEMGRDLGYK